MRKPQRQAISREINHRMSDYGLKELHVKEWSGDLASASLTVEFIDTDHQWDHQNMKTLFDLVAFFGAKPEDVVWDTHSYDEYGSQTEELHVHFSGLDLTRFKVETHEKSEKGEAPATGLVTGASCTG